MKIDNINTMIRGWYIGNFEPSIYKTEQFEIGLLHHKKGECWPAHIHKIATEINLLIKGKMIINDIEINEGDIFTIYPNEVALPIFTEDCEIIVIKIPSIIGDKYNV